MAQVKRFSPTEAQDFLRCHRKWLWSYYYGWSPKYVHPALVTGTGVHSALENYYLTGDPSVKPYDDHIAAAVGPDAMEELELTDKAQERIALARQMLIEYFTHNERMGLDAVWKVIATECVARVPIPFTDYELQGQIDMVVQDLRTGSHWIVDHKTSADLYTSEQQRNLQFAAYWWMADTLWPQLNLQGVIVNVIRMKKPTVPKMTPTGNGMSRDKSIMTTALTFTNALVENGLTPDGYEDHLFWLDANQKFFQRVTVVKDRNQRGVIAHNLEAIADQMDACIKTERHMLGLPSDDWMCSYTCDFASPCEVIESGGSIDQFMGTSMIQGKGLQWRRQRVADVTMDNATEWLGAAQKGE